jgi:hypothetical protein
MSFFKPKKPSVFISHASFNSRRLRWTGHVARMRDMRGAYRVLVGKPVGKNHMKDPGIDGRIFKWISEK